MVVTLLFHFDFVPTLYYFFYFENLIFNKGKWVGRILWNFFTFLSGNITICWGNLMSTSNLYKRVSESQTLKRRAMNRFLYSRETEIKSNPNNQHPKQYQSKRVTTPGIKKY